MAPSSPHDGQSKERESYPKNKKRPLASKKEGSSSSALQRKDQKQGPPRLELLAGKERRLKSGHLWVYQGELKSTPKSHEPGQIADLFDSRGKFLARGTYNPHPQIAFRALTFRSGERIDGAWIRARILAAAARRGKYFVEGDPCRLVFSEGDGLPGLIADRYGSVITVQILTAGMERFKSDIVAALSSLSGITGIHERSDVSVRRHEGLPESSGVLWGEVPDEIEISFDGLTVPLFPKEGQKTGLYLDQRFNRAAAAKFAPGKRVLDVFANTGLFGIYALKEGASSVTSVEMSSEMAELCRKGAARNAPNGTYDVIVGNAFDVLREKSDAGEKYDLIILDPPAFTKSAKTIEGALRGYKEINLRAVKMLPVGGILVSCTCSYHVNEAMYLEAIAQAAQDARARLVLVEARGQSPDHPIRLGVPETRYLTCLILERVE